VPEGIGAGRDGRTALRRLSELACGRPARLHAGELEPGEACLLSAMGLMTGCRLIVRVTGDPCIVEVRSTRIGLSRSVAERLHVLPDAGEAGS